MPKRIRRAMAVAMALCLFALPMSGCAEAFLALVTANSSTVYSDAAETKKLSTLKKYALVTVEAYEAGVAKVTKSGKTGYMNVSDLTAVSKAGTTAEVTAKAKVYKSASTKAKSITISAGLRVNLLGTSGDWAMVERNGAVGYMKKKLVKTVDEGSGSAVDPVVTETYAAQVAVSKMQVYASASASSTVLGALGKGAGVTVRAYNSTWAYIERDGRLGFCKLSEIAKVVAPSSTVAPSSDRSYITDTSLSVEKRIYLFVSREMGLKVAAACAILANVERECDFNVNDLSYDGGYGIVQWTGARNTALKNWCAQNGYDYTKLEGQLWFLKYELETSQSKTYTYLKNIANTPAGAYDAAYYFCYYFEIPANRVANSVRRGNLAKDTYWQKYAV